GMRLLGQGRVDGQGKYRLSVPQTTAEHYRLTLLATAPGYAPGCNLADPATVTASEHTISARLGSGQTVRGRLLDPARRPARGVQVHVLGLSSPTLLVQTDEPLTGLPGWPGTVTTDDDGYFTLRDIAPQTQVTLQVRDERFARQWLRFRTGQPGPVA